MQEKGILITKRGDQVKMIPNNMDALEIVLICNDISTTLCKEAHISKFKILRLFLKALFNKKREVIGKKIR